MTEDTREWLEKQQPWLKESAHRLLKNGQLADADFTVLVEMLRNPPADWKGDLPDIGSTTAKSVLRLESVDQVTNIDKLAPRKPLEFGSGNLSGIYGHNGSGKSGYARILKKACGKAGARDLRSNVYEDAPSDSGCTITYSVDGDKKSVEWKANAEPIPDLRAVDIYDSSVGRVYLDQETQVAYMPPELALYSDLVAASQEVASRLQGEIDASVTKLPPLPAEFQNTEIGKEYSRIGSSLPAEEVRAIQVWQESDEKALTELTARLAVADPAKEAAKLRNTAKEATQLHNKLKTALGLISQESEKHLDELHQSYKNSRQAVVDATKALSEHNKLEDVSPNSWRQMWEAAREYSAQSAYPGKAFPYTAEDARCVLCQQQLGDEAMARMNAFETHVKSSLAAAEKAAKKAYGDELAKLPDPPTQASLETSYAAAALSDELKDSLNRAWEYYGSHFERIRNECPRLPDDTAEFATRLSSLGALEGTVKDQIRKADELEKHANSFDRATATARHNELLARKWTANQSTAIAAEVARCKALQGLQKLKNATNTQGLSRQASKVSEALITEAYVARFNQELATLRTGSNIPLQAALEKTRTAHGNALHRVTLQGTKQHIGSTHEILSEGEFRLVTIAAFLADVTGKPGAAPFIFDDPISSLDHDFEWAVAQRLVKLADTRQVIVLTHRLSLFGGLEDAAKTAGCACMRTSIEALGKTCGHPVEGSVVTDKTEKATNKLITRVIEAKKPRDAGDAELYKALIQATCSDFRKIVERTIEDDLLSKVVRRHRRSIQTLNQLPKLAKITKEDCAYIDELMTKYSFHEHSQSLEDPVRLPDADEFQRDIEALRDWRKEFSKRSI